MENVTVSLPTCNYSNEIWGGDLWFQISFNVSHLGLEFQNFNNIAIWEMFEIYCPRVSEWASEWVVA